MKPKSSPSLESVRLGWCRTLGSCRAEPSAEDARRGAHDEDAATFAADGPASLRHTWLDTHTHTDDDRGNGSSTHTKTFTLGRTRLLRGGGEIVTWIWFGIADWILVFLSWRVPNLGTVTILAFNGGEGNGTSPLLEIIASVAPFCDVL